MQTTQLSPFRLLPFSFPSCSRQDDAEERLLTRRAWGVKSSVHNIAFWQGLPLRDISRLSTFHPSCAHPAPLTRALQNNIWRVCGRSFWTPPSSFGVFPGAQACRKNQTLVENISCALELSAQHCPQFLVLHLAPLCTSYLSFLQCCHVSFGLWLSRKIQSDVSGMCFFFQWVDKSYAFK